MRGIVASYVSACMPGAAVNRTRMLICFSHACSTFATFGTCAAPMLPAAAGRAQASRRTAIDQRRPPNSQSRIWRSKCSSSPGRPSLRRAPTASRVGAWSASATPAGRASSSESRSPWMINRSRNRASRSGWSRAAFRCSGLALCDHEEAGVGRPLRRLPHRPAEQVLEAADDVLRRKGRRALYGSRSTNARAASALGRSTMWRLPVHCSRSAASVGPRAIMPPANPSM